MCGISGFLIKEDGSRNIDKIARAMSDALQHRGPDASGLWSDNRSIVLAHRRLSIQDLSIAGNQPMASSCGRYVIIFNGEIYNHLLLRKNIKKDGWRGHSDTETLVEAISHWGLKKALESLGGMFAFAAWDKQKESLILARDRIGEKPLYYGRSNGTFMFGSELKSLRMHPDFDASINIESVGLFLKYNYVPAPHTIYRDFYKLPPGSYLEIDREGRFSSSINYWNLSGVINQSAAGKIESNEEEVLYTLEETLKGAIKRQMISDVPLGAFLSGGVDSSTIVALMQSQSSKPVKTFTVGFEEQGYNEAVHARAVARHLGTDHTEITVTPDEAMSVIPNLATLYDEPFADSSQIPTFLISSLARKHVTVCLSGDGGDELFGGYNRYTWSRSLVNRTRFLPRSARSLLAGGLLSVKPGQWDKLFGLVARLAPGNMLHKEIGEKIHKLAGVLDSNSAEEMYDRLVSQWSDVESLVPGSRAVPRHVFGAEFIDQKDIESSMMYSDLMNYLPDDILVKVDRAAMGVSLETRIPFLDQQVVEYAWSLPLGMKIRNGKGKWPIRKILSKYVPDSIMERPKTGFGVPIGDWLRGPLRDWAEDLLDPAALSDQNLLDPDPIRKRWSEHIDGKRNWQHSLWGVLMLQAWIRRWG